jgi:hypothetical protein
MRDDRFVGTVAVEPCLFFERQPQTRPELLVADSRGRAWVSIDPPANLEDVRAVTVTDEPAPASTAPTGATLLDGRF